MIVEVKSSLNESDVSVAGRTWRNGAKTSTVENPIHMVIASCSRQNDAATRGPISIVGSKHFDGTCSKQCRPYLQVSAIFYQNAIISSNGDTIATE